MDRCLPVTNIVVFFPNLLIVFLVVTIAYIGFTLDVLVLSCLVELPPYIPPALFELNLSFLPVCDISSELCSPLDCAYFIPAPRFTPYMALILIKLDAVSESSFE
jgi:hypothetical protein